MFNQVAPDYLEGLLLELPGGGRPSAGALRDVALVAALLHRAADLNHPPHLKEVLCYILISSSCDISENFTHYKIKKMFKYFFLYSNNTKIVSENKYNDFTITRFFNVIKKINILCL